MGSGRTEGWQRDVNRAIGAGNVVGLDDAELLSRFVERSGGAAEVAFEAIINRYGPMVLGVCRSLLSHTADADDAFQTTFLVLVRKAASVRVGDSLGPWLSGVARRVTTRSRADTRRIGTREITGLNSITGAVSPPDPSRFDLAAVVCEELDRLPAKYRSAVILCHHSLPLRGAVARGGHATAQLAGGHPRRATFARPEPTPIPLRATRDGPARCWSRRSS